MAYRSMRVGKSNLYLKPKKYNNLDESAGEKVGGVRGPRRVKYIREVRKHTQFKLYFALEILQVALQSLRVCYSGTLQVRPKRFFLEAAVPSIRLHCASCWSRLCGFDIKCIVTE